MTSDRQRIRNCAISYVPEAYGVNTKNILGRQSAGREFLKAYIKHSGLDDFICMAASPQDYDAFIAQTQSFTSRKFSSFHINTFDIYGLQQAGTVYWPDPILSQLAWLRHSWKSNAYSLCGITHTLSDIEVIESLQNMPLAPLEPWDALICTSKAAQIAVRAIMDDWSEYMAERFQFKPRSKIQLPIIPIGVDLDRFCRSEKNIIAGINLRAKLNIPKNAFVGIYFGRLNFLTKSHPTAMFIAFEEAAKQLPDRPLHLMVVGQFNNPLVKQEFESLSDKYCQTATVHWLDGDSRELSDYSWYAADFFVSLSDNMQETFGMTVVEAMAASLPTIVSDWSGLKESVVHGETGYLIPTVMPSPEVGNQFLKRSVFQIDSFSDSVAALNQVISTDIASCVSAIVKLGSNPDLLSKMSVRARARAAEKFGWDKIIGEYQELWRELEEIRYGKNSGDTPIPMRRHPGRVNPFAMFSHFSTTDINLTSEVVLCQSDSERCLNMICENISHLIFSSMMLPMSDTHKLLSMLNNNKPIQVRKLLEKCPVWDSEKLIYTLVWLNKYGFVGFL